MANWSVIVVGVTLIWRKAVATIHIMAMKLYWRHLNLADRRKIAKLKSPPNIPRIRYIVDSRWDQNFRPYNMEIFSFVSLIRRICLKWFHCIVTVALCIS